jgi:hypothetical protein
MSSIPVRIALHGLIALVPTLDPTSGANRMTALLIDGRTANAAECMSEHHPRLEVVATNTADCPIGIGCRLSGNHCICEYKANTGIDPLVGKEISLTIQPAPTPTAAKPTSDLPAHSLPADDGEASSFSYVANLSQTPFGLTINPDYLADSPASSSRANLVTRMQVPYQTIAACDLATRPDGGGANVHAMSFRELHAPSQPGEMSYALAQLVVAKLDVPDADPAAQVVTLHISDLGGANDAPITLLAASDGYKIEVSDEPAGPLDFDTPCDDGVARHFTHFYDLAQSPIGARLLPHVRFTQFENADSIDPVICKDPTFQLMNRPICPMATFNP